MAGTAKRDDKSAVLLIALRNGSFSKATLCRTLGSAKSVATYLRKLGLEVRLLKAADILTVPALIENDSVSRVTKAKARGMQKFMDNRLKQMRPRSKRLQ